MQIDLETRSKIPSEDFLGLLIEALTSSQTTGKRTNHLLWIDTRFCPEDQSFTHRCQVNRDDDLIGQLCEAPGTERAHMRDRLSERVKYWKRSFEILRGAACHDGERSID